MSAFIFICKVKPTIELVLFINLCLKIGSHINTKKRLVVTMGEGLRWAYEIGEGDRGTKTSIII